MTEVAIKFEDVSKTFSTAGETTLKQLLLKRGRTVDAAEQRFDVLRGLSFEIRKGESVALMGRNGAGKTTILKLLAGLLTPTSGGIYCSGKVTPLIELGTGFLPDLSARRNVLLNAALLGHSRAQTEALFDEIVSFAAVGDFLDLKIRHFSRGMRARLAFAIAVSLKPQILAIDEVLSVGDAQFQAVSRERMLALVGSGVTSVLVTHSLPVARDFCDRLLYLERGSIVYDGQPDQFQHSKK